jgi:hypothetical protein
MDNVRDKLNHQLLYASWNNIKFQKYPIWNRVCPAIIYNRTRREIMRKITLALNKLWVYS